MILQIFYAYLYKFLVVAFSLLSPSLIPARNYSFESVDIRKRERVKEFARKLYSKRFRRTDAAMLIEFQKIIK